MLFKLWIQAVDTHHIFQRHQGQSVSNMLSIRLNTKPYCVLRGQGRGRGRGLMGQSGHNEVQALQFAQSTRSTGLASNHSADIAGMALARSIKATECCLTCMPHVLSQQCNKVCRQ